MNSWTEAVFQEKLAQAIDHLRLILQSERRLKPPDQIPHRYDDKFALANQLTKATMTAAFRVIQLLGQDNDGVTTRLRRWSETGAWVRLRFQIESAIKFEEEVTRRESDGIEHVATHSSLFSTSKTTQKVVRVITEYRHAYLFVYRLQAWSGSDPNNDALSFWAREIRFDQLLPNKTMELSTPSIERHDVDISFLLAQIANPFAIDRQKPTCKTPRRNEDVERALNQAAELTSWTSLIVGRIESLLFGNLPNRPREEDMHLAPAFSPVLPVFVEDSDSAVLSDPDLEPLQAEHERLLKEKFADLDRAYAGAVTLQSEDVKRILLLNQLRVICMTYQGSLAFIESMLYNQLQAAVGKVLHQEDFDAFIRVHNRKLFRDEFVPTPFCYAVRRPDHAPEGVITVRASNQGDPILSHVRHVQLSYPISFPINAATMVPFEGDRFLHCCMFTNFQQEIGLPRLEISARACQFSNYILMVGTMTSARVFQPKSAIIVKDKDEVAIPLELSQLPSAKEFRDAIESLSPEQQRFCRAFRAMQLESSLFALCAIQIKPQLELVLGLPDDSLTKEIQLSQDLMELFMRYQIPSDLLAYSGDTSVQTKAKLEAVRQSVANIKRIIDEARSKQLSEVKQEATFRAAKSHHPEPFRQHDTFLREAGLSDIPSMPMPVPCSMPSSMPAMSNSIRHRANIPVDLVEAPVAHMPVDDYSCQEIDLDVSAAQASTVPSTGQSGPSQGQPQQPQQQERADPGRDQFAYDFTKLPASLDRQLERLDKSGHLRPTKLLLQSPWERTRQESLLSEAVKRGLEQDEQDREKNAAFDLLDALSKSGSLPIKSASLHVLVAFTHNFSQSLVETLIEENINPIESLERSLLITASTLHQVQTERLIRPEFLEQSRISSADLLQLDSAERIPSQ